MGSIMDIERVLLWIILLPLFGAIINGLLGRFSDRKLVGALGVATVAGSFFLAILAFIELLMRDSSGGATLSFDFYEWFSITLPGGRVVPIEIRFVMDSLSGVMTLVVTGIGLLIHIYSLGYMSEEKSFARFFAYLNLFTASMLILVLASSFPLMFVGWEGVGLCSYLLIGFWYENTDYAKAGRKAFIANRIGDFGVLIGMFILVSVAGSFEFADINQAAPALSRPFMLGELELGTLATVAGLLLFLGCTGKSAQIPLFVWLPDAMAGPTPVSALIHAATMVTAGVYLCARLSAVFLATPTTMAVIAIIGALTALLAASIALVQKEMKKILAYSTVSQLGFMFAAVGVGAFAAGFFHVFTHAFFKACLFLGAGSVMHAVGAHGDANIFKLGGMRKFMPSTRITFLFACVAIAGFPMTSGFFSKDEILLGASQLAFAEAPFSWNWVGWFVLIALFIAAIMTAFYMFRMYHLVFSGEYRSADDKGDHAYSAHPHESPTSMTLPLWILGGGALIVGFLGMPHALHLPSWWGGWMANSVQHLEGAGPHDEIANMAPVWVAMTLGLLAWAIGHGSAYLLYGKGTGEDPLTGRIPARLHQLMFDKWRVDELYAFLILRPIAALAVFAARLDKLLIDGVLTWLTSHSVALAGWCLSRLQTGQVFVYGAAMALGLAGITWWFVTPHVELEARLEGDQFVVQASRGLGYEYRFDLDSDGVYDFPPQHGVETFTAAARHQIPAGSVEPAGMSFVISQREGEDIAIAVRSEPSPIPEHALPRFWNGREPDSTILPVVYERDGQYFIRPNGAILHALAEHIREDTPIALGTVVEVGAPTANRAALRLVPRAEVRVQARSVFGNVTSALAEVLLEPAGPSAPAAALIRDEVTP